MVERPAETRSSAPSSPSSSSAASTVSAPSGPSALDLTYAALADPTRREILRRLQQAREARVTDLARPLPMSLAAVSKHIAVLERAGLVRRDVRGRDHYLRAAPEQLADAERWIAEYTHFWERRADALAEHLAKTVGTTATATAGTATGIAAGTGTAGDTGASLEGGQE
jgi:DNA-binding transcriptional ArsR family regulator